MKYLNLMHMNVLRVKYDATAKHMIL
jgi:hypothetical protein